MGPSVLGRERGRRSALLAFAAVLAMPPGSARGDEPPPDGVVLKWNVEPGAGPGCASPEEIEERVDAILERRAFAPRDEAAPWASTIEVRLSALDASGRQRAQVTLRTAEQDDSSVERASEVPRATREIVASTIDCRSLDEPLALVIALVIDAELASEPEPAPPNAVEPEPTPPEPEEPEGPILTAPTLQDGVHRPWSFEVGVGALAAIGTLPGPALGAEMSGALTSPGRFGARAHGAGFLPQDEAVGESASASFFFAYAGVDVCPTTFVQGRWRLRPCVGASLGRMHVGPMGLDQALTATQILAQGEATLDGSLRLVGGWRATASVGALFPVRADRFVFRRADGSSDLAFQQAPLALVAGLGVAFVVE